MAQRSAADDLGHHLDIAWNAAPMSRILVVIGVIHLVHIDLSDSRSDLKTEVSGRRSIGLLTDPAVLAHTVARKKVRYRPDPTLEHG